MFIRDTASNYERQIVPSPSLVQTMTISTGRHGLFLPKISTVQGGLSFVTNLCVVCDRENKNRSGSFFCSDPCSARGDLVASRARQADSSPADNPKTVGEWRASYRRFSHKNELAPYRIPDDQ